MTDAIGQVTTFSYNDSADANRITQVTDPFGRFCSLQYDENGNLTSVTDMQGMTSTFAYQHSINANLLTSMTTPYGTTTFAFSGEPNYDCTLLVTEPDGEQEKAEFDQTINYAEPDLPIPVGLTVTPNTTFIGMRDSYFWDENAMQLAPGDFSKARVYHWMHTPDGVYRSNLLESMKNPLESRTWFDYPGQTDPIIESTNMQSLPSMVARVLDDGSTQLEQYAYNAQNKVTQSVDAAGRVMYYDYDPNGADLLDVRDGSGDILTTTTYNAGHEPITSTDAAGKVTHYSYNGQGQLTSVQRPSGATTTLNYNGQGFLTSVQPPQPGATVSFTYDNFNRVQTTTDAVNGTLTYSYDNLNRLLSVAYPDGTHETLTYNKLDVNTVTDRKGHTTTMTYDALRHLRTVVDPDNRLTQYNFCGCGALRQLIDAAGNATNWTYDVAMRPIIKAYADGSQYQYQYENRSSRIKAVTDAKGQASNYGYFIDNRLEAISYVNAKVSTPNVAFQYDSLLGRLTQMTDGTGQTTYNYYPFASGQLGAGRLSSVGVAYTGVQISYLYDMDGRIVGRGVNGTLESYTYDTNARLTQVSNPLGNFGYQYNPSTANLSEIDYPNGQKTSLSYYDASKSGWLKEINNQGVGGSNLSDFTYDYDPAGQITSWAKTIANNPSQAYTFTYDPAGQLTQAVQSQGSGMTYAYTYDAAGNRTLETMNGVGTSSAANNLNQLMNVYGNSGTKVQFQGKAANVLASVTINGLSATVNTDQTFSTFMSLTPGVANTITITAADVSGDTVTHRYSILNGYKPTYDANGNMNRDGHYQYTWDAENRLVAISLLYPGVGNPAKSWDFAYDGFGRRVDEKYILGATLAQETRYVWAGSDLVEARGTDGSVWKRYFGTGMQILSPTAQAGVYYYTSDHLGSIRELTDATGAVRAEYDYDPWGRRTKLSGDLDADFGFTGDFEHASGLKLTWYREYNPDLGRWLSRDPLRIQGGEINLYAYVNDNPINLLDLFGLCPNNSGENTGQDNQAQNASDWDNVKKTEQMNGIPTDEYEEASLDVARANQVTAKRVALAYAGIGAAVIVAGLALVAAEAIGEGLAGAASWQLVSADLAGEGLFDSYHLKEIWDKVQKLLGNGDVCENNQ
jgi:RHS repeat-associated protein